MGLSLHLALALGLALDTAPQRERDAFASPVFQLPSRHESAAGSSRTGSRPRLAQPRLQRGWAVRPPRSERSAASLPARVQLPTIEAWLRSVAPADVRSRSARAGTHPQRGPPLALS